MAGENARASGIDTHIEDIRARAARFSRAIGGPFRLDIAFLPEDEEPPTAGSIGMELVVSPADPDRLGASLDLLRAAFLDAFPSGACVMRVGDPIPCTAARRGSLRVITPTVS